MSADALSQEEIDALLKGTSSRSEKASDTPGAQPPTLSSVQVQALSKYGDQMATTLADLIGTFLANPAQARRQDPSPHTDKSAANAIQGSIVLALFSYTSGLRGDSFLAFQSSDACRIGGTMVGEPEATEFTPAISDAFKEVIHTIIGNLNTGLGRPVGAQVSSTTVELEPFDSAPEPLSAALGGNRQLALIPYPFEITGIVSGTCYQGFSMDMVESLEVLVPPAASAAPPAPARQAPAVRASPVEFDSLTDEALSAGMPGNLDLIMDISLEVRVQLGKSHLKIRDILKLGGGSVVELDKLAGEPVDLLVNDVIFAKGEVVVIDENFGVRITEILSLQERIKSLGERRS